MARVPINLVRNGVDLRAGPSKYQVTQKKLFEMRRQLHLRLRDMTDDDLRRVSMCTFESMMMQLWREGHIWTGKMLTEFVELDKVARKLCLLVAPELRRASLRKEKKLLRLLADDLCSAEDAMCVGDKAAQSHHILLLAEEVATRGVSWWWLTERLLKEATWAVKEARDDGELSAKIAFATGVFLLDQLHESGEAVVELTNAMRLAQKGRWLASKRLMMAYQPPAEEIPLIPVTKTETEEPEERTAKPVSTVPLDFGTEDEPVSLFECSSAVLCRALLQEARRARLGCPFGVSFRKETVPKPQPKKSSLIRFKDDLTEDQGGSAGIRMPRVLQETSPVPLTSQTLQQLDFISILKEDMGEPEVQNKSKIDAGSATAFCREAAQHARNAGRRDLEEAALLELGLSLQTGNQFAEALQSMQTVLDMYKKDENSSEEIKTNFYLALCYQKMGKTEEALTNLQTALFRAQETGNHSTVFTAQKYLGMFFLNTSQRQYATTHLALALLQVNNYFPGNYQRRLIRVLAGLAGANEVMTPFISILRSTEFQNEEGRESMLRLLNWKEKRTAFWPTDQKVSRVVQTLEMTLPPQMEDIEDIDAEIPLSKRSRKSTSEEPPNKEEEEDKEIEPETRTEAVDEQPPPEEES